MGINLPVCTGSVAEHLYVTVCADRDSTKNLDADIGSMFLVRGWLHRSMYPYNMYGDQC